MKVIGDFTIRDQETITTIATEKMFYRHISIAAPYLELIEEMTAK